MSLRTTLLVLALLTAHPSAVTAAGPESGGRLLFGVIAQGYALPGEETRPALAKADLNGFGVGGSVGYDWNLGNRWVAGLEIDAVKTDSDAAINRSRYNVDYLLSARARLGYRMRSDLMLYATGGYAIEGLDYRGATTPTIADPNPVLKATGTVAGFAVGGGVEWAHGNYVVFTEYLYASFESWRFAGGFGINHSLDTEAHQFRVGFKRTLDFP